MLLGWMLCRNRLWLLCVCINLFILVVGMVFRWGVKCLWLCGGMIIDGVVCMRVGIGRVFMFIF